MYSCRGEYCLYDKTYLSNFRNHRDELCIMRTRFGQPIRARITHTAARGLLKDFLAMFESVPVDSAGEDTAGYTVLEAVNSEQGFKRK